MTHRKAAVTAEEARKAEELARQKSAEAVRVAYWKKEEDEERANKNKVKKKAGGNRKKGKGKGRCGGNNKVSNRRGMGDDDNNSEDEEELFAGQQEDWSEEENRIWGRGGCDFYINRRVIGQGVVRIHWLSAGFWFLVDEGDLKVMVAKETRASEEGRSKEEAVLQEDNDRRLMALDCQKTTEDDARRVVWMQIKELNTRLEAKAARLEAWEAAEEVREVEREGREREMMEREMMEREWMEREVMEREGRGREKKERKDGERRDGKGGGEDKNDER